MSGPPDSITSAWARWACGLRPQDLPAAVTAIAQDRLLDAVGTALAARSMPVPDVVRRFVGRSRGMASVIGSADRLPGVDAAFLNAVLVNGGTHDDFIAKSHAGAVTIPAALAAAEEAEHPCSGLALLAAIVVGYECVARAYLGGPQMLPRFRATGVAGTFGAAAAASCLMHAPVAQMGHALGLAAMFSSGFGEGFHSGTKDVKLNVGWASRSGLSAAQLARCGATASPTVLEGESGFYHAFANGTADVAQATAGLGERFLIEDTVYKERPVCIFVQTPVELAATLSREHGLARAAIEGVRVRAPLATLTNPGYRNTAPFATALQARISARFTVAAALLGHPVDSPAYYELEPGADVLALAERVELLEPGPDGEVRVEVQAAGRHLEAIAQEMDHLRPRPDKTIAKFRRLTQDIPEPAREALLQTLLDIERLPCVSVLGERLRAC